jgi:hypothetical protein
MKNHQYLPKHHRKNIAALSLEILLSQLSSITHLGEEIHDLLQHLGAKIEGHICCLHATSGNGATTGGFLNGERED